MSKRNQSYQTLVAFLGNLFEHYDTALFGLLSPFIATLFFPSQSYVYSLMLTYAIIPLGMLSKPLGSLFFGYVGDNYGREKALQISLGGMALSSCLLGVLPTYAQIGVFSPIFLSLIRLSQNFFAAGEVIGGAIYILEKSKKSKRDFFSGLFDASTIAGIIIASLAVTALSTFAIVESYWRILFFLGAITGLFALVIRNISASSLALEPISYKLSSKYFSKVMWDHKKEIFMIACAAGFSYSCYSISLVLMNGLVPLISDYSNEEMVMLNSILLGVDFILLPLFASLAWIFPREKLMRAAAFSVIVTAFPLFKLLDGASLVTISVIRLLLVGQGVWFSATFHSWSQSLVHQKHRYLVVGFAYALGSQVLGGPTASISLWMYHNSENVAYASCYWVFLAITACVSIHLSLTKKEEKVLVKNTIEEYS